MSQQETLAALFNRYRDDTVVNRCEQYARWTLPHLMTDTYEVSTSGRVVVERDFQEVGPMLVNNLASKLARLLFPTQAPFFQANTNAAFNAAMAKQGMAPDAIRSAMSSLEKNANARLFVNSGYAALILALRHLVVAGNVLLYRDTSTGSMSAYGVQTFSTSRDGTGLLLDCIHREFTSLIALPEDIQAALRMKSRERYSRDTCKVKKYTRIKLCPRNGIRGYEVSQAVDDQFLGVVGWYPEKLCPWMVPTWTLIPGEHYGRGMVEEYAGGFAKLSSLSEAEALYAVESMRVLHLVGPSGGDIDQIATAESGEWVRGDPGQVRVHEAGDSSKLQAIAASIDRTVLNLSKAFMYQGATRQGERVTAYELQRDAQEAEYGLGGVYSTLSGGIQVPLAHILMTEVSEFALPGIVSGELAPDVVAGIPALGRNADVQNLLMAAQELATVVPITQLDQRLNPQRLVDIVLAGRSIDPTTVFFSPQEMQAKQEAQQAQASAQQNLLAANTLADQGDQIAQTLGA